MGFWTDLYNRIRRRKETATAIAPRRIARAYNAAVANRITNDWVTSPTSERTERRNWLRAMRARSRDLVRNDDYVKQFIRLCKTNIIGRGIKFQAQAKMRRGGKMDSMLNTLVEQAFNDWGKKDNCTTSGRLSWCDAQRRFAATLARDGEVLVRLIYDAANPYGFALHFLDVGWLDETYSGYNNATGNRIIMSVELNSMDKPVAYWLSPPIDHYTDPNMISAQRGRVRIPADEIIHEFIPDDTEDDTTTRGIPWTAAAALKIKILNGYEEAELVAARVGACKGGFLKPPADRQYDGDEPDVAIEEVEPGMIQELPPGYEWQAYDPNHPNQNYGDFVKSCLRSISAGLGVSYNGLANDLESTSYSSIRAGLLQERDVWRSLQDFVIEHFCEPVFQRWIEAAWLSDQLEISAEDLGRIKAKFQPRGFSWPDPMKEAEALTLEINSHLTTRSDVLAERGLDFEETVERLKYEKEALVTAGLWIDPQQPAARPDTTE